MYKFLFQEFRSLLEGNFLRISCYFGSFKEATVPLAQLMVDILHYLKKAAENCLAMINPDALKLMEFKNLSAWR